jgi:uncharacterized protein YkwD
MARLLAAVCVVSALLVPAATPAKPTAQSAERSIVGALNDVRRAHGLRPLPASAALRASAHAVASSLMKRDAFGHADRIAAGGRFRVVGEALAIHRGWRPRARRTVRRWLRSPSHRAVVLGRFRRAGAGMVRGRFGGRLATIWVLHVGG